MQPGEPLYSGWTGWIPGCVLERDCQEPTEGDDTSQQRGDSGQGKFPWEGDGRRSRGLLLDGVKFVIEMMREEERIRLESERERSLRKQAEVKIGGMVTIAVGVGLGIFFYCMHLGESGPMGHLYLVGLIPGLIGVALTISAYLFLPEPRE